MKKKINEVGTRKVFFFLLRQIVFRIRIHKLFPGLSVANSTTTPLTSVNDEVFLHHHYHSSTSTSRTNYPDPETQNEHILMKCT